MCQSPSSQFKKLSHRFLEYNFCIAIREYLMLVSSRKAILFPHSPQLMVFFISFCQSILGAVINYHSVPVGNNFTKELSSYKNQYICQHSFVACSPLSRTHEIFSLSCLSEPSLWDFTHKASLTFPGGKISQQIRCSSSSHSVSAHF